MEIIMSLCQPTRCVSLTFQQLANPEHAWFSCKINASRTPFRENPYLSRKQEPKMYCHESAGQSIASLIAITLSRYCASLLISNLPPAFASLEIPRGSLPLFCLFFDHHQVALKAKQPLAGSHIWDTRKGWGIEGDVRRVGVGEGWLGGS